MSNWQTDAELRATADRMAQYLVRGGWLPLPISKRTRKKYADEYYHTLKRERDSAQNADADAAFDAAVELDKSLRMR